MDNNQKVNPNQQPARGTIGKTNMDLNKTPAAATNSGAPNKNCEAEKEALEEKNSGVTVAPTDSATTKHPDENK